MNSTEPLICGDIVTLKSGGPPMTVRQTDRIEKETRVVCEWCSDAGVPHKAIYLIDQLVRP